MWREENGREGEDVKRRGGEEVKRREEKGREGEDVERREGKGRVEKVKM